MSEVSYSREQHRQAEAVGGFDDLGIALGASGLNDRGGASFRDLFNAIREWEKGI